MEKPKKELPRVVLVEQEQKKVNQVEERLRSEIREPVVEENITPAPEEEHKNKKIKRINTLKIEKREIPTAPHPPDLPVPKMPVKAPHPPELPEPIKATLPTRIKLFFMNYKKRSAEKKKTLVQNIKKINYLSIAIGILIVISLVSITIGVFSYLSLDESYNNAIEKANKGSYNELIYFCAIHEKYGKCYDQMIYVKALSLLQTENYTEAKKEFNRITTFKDASDYIKYIDAIQILETQNISQAKLKFNEVEELEKAKYYLTYIEIIELINSDQIANAEILIKTIEDEIDASSITDYFEAIQVFQEGDYKKVVDLLQNNNMMIENASIMYKEAKYNYAKEEQQQGNISTAYKMFKELGEYNDVKSILEQPIFKLINNWNYTISVGDKTSTISLSFYESTNTVFHYVKNGNLLGLAYDEDETTYTYRIRNNVLYFQNSEGEFKPIYQIQDYGDNQLTIQVNSKLQLRLDKAKV